MAERSFDLGNGKDAVATHCVSDGRRSWFGERSRSDCSVRDT